LIERIYPPHVRKPEAMLFEGRVPGTPKSFRRAWATLRASVRRVDLHRHDLRHNRAAAMLKSGVSIPVTARTLGHSPQVLARRHGHLEVQVLEKAIETSWT
jgi:integrase